VVNEPAQQTANFTRSVYLLIMIDTFSLRPSLHFPKLHPTSLPRILYNLGNKTSTFSIDYAFLCESDDTGSVTLQGIYMVSDPTRDIQDQ